MGTDIQFYAFIISIIYIIYVPVIHFTWEIKVFCFYALFAAIIGLLSTDNAPIYIRCLFQYASLFLITLAIYNLFVWENGIDEYICKLFIWIWFIVGFIQTFIYHDFCTLIVSNSRTTLDRGVGSLASEPSFYGIQCFYFMFIASIFISKKNLYWGLVISMSLLFAKSFTGIFFILICCFLLAIDRINIKNIPFKWVIAAIFIIPTLIYFATIYFKSTRMGKLVSMIFSNQALFIEDESSAVRFRAITDALHTSYESVFMPIGFTSRVGSMFGGILQELGIFGIVLMCLMAYILASYSKKVSVKYIAFVSWMILLFTNMQLANPTLAFIMAIGIYKNSKLKYNV